MLAPGLERGRRPAARDRGAVRGTAIVLTNGALRTQYAKTAHGLIRGSERFEVLAVVDPVHAGADAGAVLDGVPREIPVRGSIAGALEQLAAVPDYCIVGVATHGGTLTDDLRALLREALGAGMSIVNGLHDFCADDPELAALADARGLRLVDVRRPPPAAKLHFWSGDVMHVTTPILAVLGTDCAVGKRTTTKLLVDCCRRVGVHAEMIFTGQTGWMQGARHGFVLDATPNDFVSGELEHAIVRCAEEVAPDLIVIEGQSSLRNPSGPCGAELIVSGRARGVILQHAPGRTHFLGHEQPGCELPTVEQEIALARTYGADTIAVTLNGEGIDALALREAQAELSRRLRVVPVVRPLEEGIETLLPAVLAFVEANRRSSG